MIDAGKAVVVVLGLQHAGVFRGKPKISFRRIDPREGRKTGNANGNTQILPEVSRQDRRFGAALAFVIGEEESLVPNERTAKSGAELILLKAKRRRSWLQQRPRVGRAVLQVFVYRPVKVVGAGFGDDVDDPAYRPAVFRAEAAVHHAELGNRLLRGRG